MRELVRRQAEGVRPIWATCEDLLTPRPLGSLLDLVDEHQAGELGTHPTGDTLVTWLLSEMSFSMRPAVAAIERRHPSAS